MIRSLSFRPVLSKIAPELVRELDQLIASLQVWTGRLENLEKVLTTQYDKTVTALSEIPELTVTLVAGKSYWFHAHLFISQNVTGGSGFSMGGTATARIFRANYVSIDDATNAFDIVVQRNTITATPQSKAGMTLGVMQITGFISVDTGGTFAPRFGQHAQSGTSSVLIGSTFRVKELL